ncbi:hypothetical protein [Kineosporia babensis]|uniref:Uncharacterized protein n=1 Tax=Kineosporia babensis TaxID=499548 RepID=A0A9X1SWK3_9ACTN|nr:hypothetical protein [Kineosporia babensis]MCD5314125.1 hypothetical protein [Kineosporia babensis]
MVLVLGNSVALVRARRSDAAFGVAGTDRAGPAVRRRRIDIDGVSTRQNRSPLNCIRPTRRYAGPGGRAGPFPIGVLGRYLARTSRTAPPEHDGPLPSTARGDPSSVRLPARPTGEN